MRGQLKPAVLLAVFASALMIAGSTASAAAPKNLDVGLASGAAIARSSVYWIATSGCRYDDCDVLLRTTLSTRKTRAVKHIDGRISALVGAGPQVAYSDYKYPSLAGAVYLSTNGSKFKRLIRFKRHDRNCNDSVVAEDVSPEGAVVWTRYIERRCTTSKSYYEATIFAKWPGEPARKLGRTRRVSDQDGDLATDIQFHNTAVAIRGRKVLAWIWPDAVLYDADGLPEVKLSSNGGTNSVVPPVALGPGGRVIVSHTVSAADVIEAPLLHSDPNDLSKSTLMQEPLGSLTLARFCGSRIVTFNEGEGGASFNVRALDGTVTSRVAVGPDSRFSGIDAIYCDETTAVVQLSEPDSESGEAVYAVKLP